MHERGELIWLYLMRHDISIFAAMSVRYPPSPGDRNFVLQAPGRKFRNFLWDFSRTNHSCAQWRQSCRLRILYSELQQQILYVKYVNYERISLRRLNYSNYAPNTPQWQRSACQWRGQQTKKKKKIRLLAATVRRRCDWLLKPSWEIR